MADEAKAAPVAQTKPKSGEPERYDKYGNERSAWRAWNWQQNMFDQWQEDKELNAAKTTAK